MLKWYPCEMHCHTRHSDGKFTVDELMQTAKAYDLEGIALTDHNTVSGWKEITGEKEKNTVAVLKGIEWTTYFGHMLVTGCAHFVDWRDAVPDTIDEKIAEIKAYGGMVGIAHPYELGSPMCTGGHWEYHVHKWENVDYIEVWSKPFPASKSANERAMLLWNTLLDRGYRLAATYGKDWHGRVEETVPGGCTYIGIQDGERLTGNLIKEAVQHGRTAVTMGPSVTLGVFQNGIEYTIGDEIECGAGVFHIAVDTKTRRKHWENLNIKADAVRLVATGNKTVFTQPVEDADCVIEAAADIKPGWYRAELDGTVNGARYMLGFTSPVYVRKK